jgi:hypothetical protein
VNLSQDANLAEALISSGAVEKVMEILGKPGCRINRLLVMLLVNLTQVESGALELLQVNTHTCLYKTPHWCSSKQRLSVQDF